MTERRRNVFILLVVAGLLAASIVAILTKPTQLGLDLKGGVQLVYEGRPSAVQKTVTPDALNRAIDIIRERVDAFGVAEPEIQQSGARQIVVGLPGVKDEARAESQVGQVAQLAFYDWEKNVILPNGKSVADQERNQDQAALSLSQSGGATAAGQPVYDAVKLAHKQPVRTYPQMSHRGPEYYAFTKRNRWLAGPTDTRADLIADIQQRTNHKTLPPGGKVITVPQGTVVLQAVDPDAKTIFKIGDPNARFYVLKDDVALFGNDLRDPKQGFNQTQQPDVEFNFTNKGKGEFQNVTRDIAHRGADLQLPGQGTNLQHFAVALDNKLLSVASIDYTDPNLADGIDGSNGAIIEGGFTIQSAQDLAKQLQFGALPIKLKLISKSKVSATLGKQALHQGLVAGIAGLAIVALFLIIFYRVLGLIAVAALAVYAIYLFALIKVVPITLTLPGIAGLILTIGVAADANIVIFERVKEEVRSGKSVPNSIRDGYRRGLSAIIDANVVTLMTAFILFILATAGVKGFAFTLGIGTIVSLFTAVMATQAILMTMSRTRSVRGRAALGASGEGRHWRFDFMGASKWFFSFSGVILLIGALAIGAKGLNFGIDFESGTRITTGFVKPAGETAVRNALNAAGVSDAEVQRLQNKDLGPYAFQISSRKLQPDQVDKVKAALDTRFGLKNESDQSIGPTFGQTVANDAVVAIIASLLVISAYIALRFEWKYAVPVLIALMHDLLITSGVYSLTGREVTTSTVAALLTILGYSLYDTIIVFDRVRENVPRMPRAAFSQIVNRSMSEVLNRSLATTFCTLLPVLALLFFGGTTLKDFAFALLIGIASGAYSSIFIASPVLTHWKEREEVYRARRHRIEGEFGEVPAYATAVGGGPVDVEPAKRRARRPGRITTPDVPGEAVSKAEFEEMKRELGLDEEETAARSGSSTERSATGPVKRRAPRPARARGALASPPPETRGNGGTSGDGTDGDSAQSGPGAAPDEAENEGMTPPDRPAKQRRPRNKKHGRR